MNATQVRRLLKSHGFSIERGAYIGTSDDRLDRWYVTDDHSSVVDRRGSGFFTIRDIGDEIERGWTPWA